MDQQKLCIEISVKEIQIIVERMRRVNSQKKQASTKFPAEPCLPG